VGILSLGNLYQFIHYMPRRRLVWIAHPEIDNIFTTRTGLGLQLVDDIEYVGWQAFNPVKIV
jgi:hypothetical protein